LNVKGEVSTALAKAGVYAAGIFANVKFPIAFNCLFGDNNDVKGGILDGILNLHPYGYELGVFFDMKQ